MHTRRLPAYCKGIVAGEERPRQNDSLPVSIGRRVLADVNRILPADLASMLAHQIFTAADVNRILAF